MRRVLALILKGRSLFRLGAGCARVALVCGNHNAGGNCRIHWRQQVQLSCGALGGALADVAKLCNYRPAPGLNLFGRSLLLHARGGRVHRLPCDSKTTGQVPAAPPQPSYPYVAKHRSRAGDRFTPCPRPTRLQRSPPFRVQSSPPGRKSPPASLSPFLSFRAPENLSHKAARTPQNPLIRLIRFTPPAQESDRFPSSSRARTRPPPVSSGLRPWDTPSRTKSRYRSTACRRLAPNRPRISPRLLPVSWASPHKGRMAPIVEGSDPTPQGSSRSRPPEDLDGGSGRAPGGTALPLRADL